MKKLIGPKLLEFLKGQYVETGKGFCFEDLSAAVKDAVIREAFRHLDISFACEAIPGVSNFGDDISEIFFKYPELYIKLLRSRVRECLVVGTPVGFSPSQDSINDVAIMIGSESTIGNVTDLKLFDLLNTDGTQFYETAYRCCMEHMESTVSKEIEEALPLWIEEGNHIFEFDKAV